MGIYYLLELFNYLSFRMSLASITYREVEAIVETWTKKYQYHISLIETKPNEVKFMVQFSLPQPQKPVAAATIRVYFSCSNHDQLKITFRFEKDCLIHSPNKTIRQQQIEKWIDDSLSKKLLVRQTVFYLGTAYESTRVKDVRQDNLLREVAKKEEIEYVYLHPDLLSDQKRIIEIMQRPHLDTPTIQKELKKHFREVDKDNIGVITHAEFLTLIKNLGVKLNATEEKEVLKKVDPQQSGMVEYQNYASAVGQFFECLEARKESQAKLATSEEQQIFGSILIMINDESQDIEELLMQKFKARDEDETGVTNISQVKVVLDEVNKKAKEENRPQPLTVIELSEITKLLTDAYGYKQIPYAKIHRHIVDFKIGQLARGRINSSLNNLQLHLKELFGVYDQKKLGRIKLQHFQQALKKSQKMKLTSTQIYMLKSLVPVDSRKEVSYVENSKFLSELIKRFYLNSSKRKQ